MERTIIHLTTIELSSKFFKIMAIQEKIQNFYDKNLLIQDHSKKFVIIYSVIFNKMDLFAIYCTSLNFPNDFGWNWDALLDMTMDLSWINEYEIQLIHENIPLIVNHDEVEKYFELLEDLYDRWLPSDKHRVSIFFHERCKSEIIKHCEMKN